MKRYKLKFWRMRQGLTQAQVAEKLGLSRGYFKDVENGLHTPSSLVLKKFMVKFNMDETETKDLFDGEDENVQ